MENTNLKVLTQIRDKSHLQELYGSQYSQRFIRNEINEIIQEKRGLPKGMIIVCKKISIQEALIFIQQNGIPKGYVLSEELKLKLKELCKKE